MEAADPTRIAAKGGSLHSVPRGISRRSENGNSDLIQEARFRFAHRIQFLTSVTGSLCWLEIAPAFECGASARDHASSYKRYFVAFRDDESAAGLTDFDESY